LDTPGANYRAVWALNKYFPNVKTFVRAHDVDHGVNLEKAGATAVSGCYRAFLAIMSYLVQLIFAMCTHNSFLQIESSVIFIITNCKPITFHVKMIYGEYI
jgi:hypothetical protein